MSFIISNFKSYSAVFFVSLNPTPAFTQYTFTSVGSAKLELLYFTIFQILAADPVTPFVFGSPIAYPKFGVDKVLSSVIPKYNGGDIVSAITVLNNIPEIKNNIKIKLTIINLQFFILISPI